MEVLKLIIPRDMKKNIRQYLVIALFILISFPFQVFGQVITQEIKVKLYDPYNQILIKDASVNIDARIVDVLPNGEMSMRSIDELQELNITGITNKNGVFETILSINNTNPFITIRVAKEGYETMINMATSLTNKKSQEIVVEMLPDIDSPKPFSKTGKFSKQAFDDFIWGRKLKLEQEKIDNGYFIDDIQGSSTEDNNQNKNASKATGCNTSFNVPAIVYVTGLINGYTGQCKGNGYTGNINFQDYIAGVISQELGSGFPLEALKAQSVASRSYALNNIEIGRGANCGHAYTSNIPQKCIDATRATNGVVAIYNNNAITAYYSARCHGDYTRSASIESCALGTPSSVSAYCKSVPCSGHINCLNAEGGSLCCTKWTPNRNRNETVFGHGVGLCQRGAQGFANRGWGWERIVNQFYSNITLTCGSVCQSSLTLTGTINSGTYRASNSIRSSGTISSGKSVIFNSPEIYLNNGFTVDANTSFEAKSNNGCNSSNRSLQLASQENFNISEEVTSSVVTKLYPNPTSKEVTIQYVVPNQDQVQIQIIDFLGKVVLKQLQNNKANLNGRNEISIDLGNLKAGMYFVNFRSGTYTETQSLIVNHN